jgi:hypothetical protein
MPQALLRTDIYTCRSENDTKYFDRSPRLFNNPTKQDRYGAAKFYALPGGGARGEPMPHGGVNEVPPTQQAEIGAWPIPQPGGALPQYKEGRLQHALFAGFGSTYATGTQAANQQYLGVKPPGKGYTSFVGVTTSGLAAPVW